MPKITVNIAEAGTEVTNPKTGERHPSPAGHMWATLTDNNGQKHSYGFAPANYESGMFKPGQVYDNDDKNYASTTYSKTIDISDAQYNALFAFGETALNAAPDAVVAGTTVAGASTSFTLHYNAFTNSCVDFAWAMLGVIGINEPRHFPGTLLLPTWNVSAVDQALTAFQTGHGGSTGVAESPPSPVSSFADTLLLFNASKAQSLDTAGASDVTGETEAGDVMRVSYSNGAIELISSSAGDFDNTILTDELTYAGGVSVKGTIVIDGSSYPVSETIVATSADGERAFIVTNTYEDRAVTQTEAVITNAEGITINEVRIFNADGTLNSETKAAVSADGVSLGKSWTRSDGSRGSESFYPDGTHLTIQNDGKGTVSTMLVDRDGNRSGSTIRKTADGVETVFVNGVRSVKTDDGKGNITTDEYYANGNPMAKTWSSSDGSTGVGTFYNDGKTRSESLRHLDGSGFENVFNLNGSYNKSVFDASGNRLNEYFGADNVLLGTRQLYSDGSVKDTSFRPYQETAARVYNSDGGYTDTWHNADGSTSIYTSIPNNFWSSSVTLADGSNRYTSGAFDGHVWNESNSVIDADGSTISWTIEPPVPGYKTFSRNRYDGTSSSQSMEADGSGTGRSQSVDGSRTEGTRDPDGFRTETRYGSDGSHTTTSFAADNSYASWDYYRIGSHELSVKDDGNTLTTIFGVLGDKRAEYHRYTDGSTQSEDRSLSDHSVAIRTDDGQGNSTSDRYDAIGQKIAHEWKHADGSHGSGVYEDDGSHSETTTDPTGNVITQRYDAAGATVSESYRGIDGTAWVKTFDAEGSSTLESAVSHVLAADDQNLTLAGTSDINGTGNERNNTIIGNSGANVIDGGAGDDVLNGGAGDDVYVYRLGDGIDHMGDSAGNDRLVLEGIGAQDFVLGVGSLKLSLPDGGEIHLDDFDPDHPLVGAIETFEFGDGTVMRREDLIRTLGFRIEGTAGNDVLSGTAFDEPLRGYGGNDVLTGRAGNDTLDGGAGDDVLDGGPGNDVLLGGDGDDVYIFGSGDGQDVATDTLGNNAIQIKPGLAEADVGLRQQGDDLALTLTTTGDKLTVEDWFAAGDCSWTLRFADGTVLDRAGVEARLIRNEAPQPADDLVVVGEDDGTALGNVLDNDIDPESRILRVTNPGTYTGSYGSLSLAADGSYSYALDGNAVNPLTAGQSVTERFGYAVSDDDPNGALAASAEFVVEIVGANDIPILVSPLADVELARKADFSWQLPAGSFTDVDNGDALAYGAELAYGSALPTWLAFDAATQTFSGHVPTNEKGSLDIRVTATDGHGSASAVSDVFRITLDKGGCDHGNEGGGNGNDVPPPGHSGNHHNGHDDEHDGHHGSKGGKDDDHDRDDRKSKQGNDDHDHKPVYLNPKDLDRHYADFAGERREADHNGYVERWIEVDLAVSGWMAAQDKSLPSLHDAKGADIGALHRTAEGFLGSTTTRGPDPLSLAAGTDLQLKSFRGLSEGLQRLG